MCVEWKTEFQKVVVEEAFLAGRMLWWEECDGSDPKRVQQGVPVQTAVDSPSPQTMEDSTSPWTPVDSTSAQIAVDSTSPKTMEDSTSPRPRWTVPPLRPWWTVPLPRLR